MIYCFDLDNTLCLTVKGNYEFAIPFLDRIEKVNKLYDSGHRIYIDTARGSESAGNYFDLTKSQLNKWGVKYHRLRTGIKFHADFYIDDKNIDFDKI